MTNNTCRRWTWRGARWLLVVGMCWLGGIGLAACRPAASAPASLAQAAPVTLTVAPTGTMAPSPTATLPPTPLPPPSPTVIPTSTPSPTVTPSPTLTPSATPTPTLTPTPDVIDRTCRQPYAMDYQRYYVPAESWPTPVAAPESHFWLSKPLPPGVGRLLITQEFPYGWDYNGRLALHNGVDVSEELGTPVLAAADGVVVVAGSDENILYGWRCNWYGQLVVIEHDLVWQDQPVFTLYGHVLNIQVEPGQRVSRGEPIAEVGFGGAAPVRHLHFEVRLGVNAYTTTRNPMLWLAPGEDRGVIAGRVVDPDGRPWQGVAIHALRQTETGLEDKTTWTYLGDPSHIARPDEHLAENFVLADLLPGVYQIYLELQGASYSAEVEVTAGQISQVELITAPFVWETPVPSETATPMPPPQSTPTP